jgi:hypothetical protein
MIALDGDDGDLQEKQEITSATAYRSRVWRCESFINRSQHKASVVASSAHRNCTGIVFWQNSRAHREFHGSHWSVFQQVSTWLVLQHPSEDRVRVRSAAILRARPVGWACKSWVLRILRKRAEVEIGRRLEWMSRLWPRVPYFRSWQVGSCARNVGTQLCLVKATSDPSAKTVAE